MKAFKLIKRYEQISINHPDRVLKLKGSVLKNNAEEYLEILIYRGFSSSTTHEIEIDLEKNVLNEKFIITNGELIKGPISIEHKSIIKKSENLIFFLEENNWR